jgi:hypothetical protein
LYVRFTAHHLNQSAGLHEFLEFIIVEGQSYFGRAFENLQVVLADVGLLILGEAVDEEGAFGLTIQNDGPEPAGPTGSGPGDPLLDNPTAQIRIDQTTLCPVHGLTQIAVRDSFMSREAVKGPVLEDSQHTPSFLNI